LSLPFFGQNEDKVRVEPSKFREEEIMAQKEQQSQKNTKKAPAKNLKEKRLEKQAKAASKK
jgi:hypothetical protein